MEEVTVPATKGCKDSNAELQGTWKIKGMILPKEHSNFQQPVPKKHICDLPNKEFKIVVLNKLRDLQEKSYRKSIQQSQKTKQED